MVMLVGDDRSSLTHLEGNTLRNAALAHGSIHVNGLLSLVIHGKISEKELPE